MSRPFPYKVGDKLGRLSIISIHKPTKTQDRTLVSAKCDCGGIIDRVRPDKIKRGHISSCGCLAWDPYDQTTHGQSYDREYRIWVTCKSRASTKGIPFEIEVSDIVIPEFCPLLGIKLNTEPNKDNRWASPSIDRLIPEKGYIKGNILICSMRANTIKNNASVDELMTLTDNLHKIMMSIPA
jgi:hypothetical protein